MIYDLGERRVELADVDHFIAESAVVVGSVRIGSGVSIWFGAVVRADHGIIDIGDRTNIQDGAVLHCDEGRDLRIGRGVTVAHRAMLHGCTVGDDTLVGIGAIVLNGALIGRNCLVGAGALVTGDTVIPDNSLVLGAPARVVRSVTEEETAEILDAAHHYVRNYQDFIQNLRSRGEEGTGTTAIR
ncbi:MAG: gamma carbonic anhydrase family protein [Spirochaetes bacterium]|nr:gamma carbonic anhydrase family protein [Spirochaetota bacterium]